MDSPTDYSREEYAALPVKVARALRRKWGQSPEQRATTPNGAPYPLRSWPPDAAIDIQNLAEWADPMKPETVRRFANAAARDAAIPAPTDGMVCYLQDLKQQQTRIGSVWYPTGGVMPGGITFPSASSLAPGVGVIATPPSQQSLYGGMRWAGDNKGYMLDYAGMYSIALQIEFNNLPAGQACQALIGHDGSVIWPGSNTYASGSTWNAVAAATAPLGAGHVINPMYYVPSGGFVIARFGIAYLGPAT